MPYRRRKKVVAVSGGFDPLHIGHLRMFTQARKLGDELVVILNNDNWLKAKKGFVFMPQRERKEFIESLGLVDRVVLTDHRPYDPDRSVAKALRKLRPAIFANGGDRTAVDAKKATSSLSADHKVCQELGIQLVFGVGKGGKVQSSSWLTDKVRMTGVKTTRPWGSMVLFAQGKNFWMKTLTVSPGERTSLQLHRHRKEQWMCVEGEVTAEVGKSAKKLTTRHLKAGDSISFGNGVIHRLSSKKGGTIIEVVYGDPDESDIVRIADDYGRP